MSRDRSKLLDARCRECKTIFNYDPDLHDTVPVICGSHGCAPSEWSDEQWQGRARMAAARAAAGVPIDDVDRVALGNYGGGA